MNGPSASGSIVFSAVVAILGSLFLLLCGLLGLIGIYMAPFSSDHANLVDMAAIMAVFFLAMPAIGVFTGVGLLRLRNWARISILIWSGITVFSSLFALIGFLLLPFPAFPSTSPQISTGAIKAVIVILYGIPMLIGISWLILFNRKSVKEQFLGRGPTAIAPDSPVRARCPLPVAIIAGFMLFSVLTMFAMPLLHLPVATILFGQRIHGEPGNFIYASSAVLYLAAAIGLLTLKRWSYPLTIVLQAFWLSSGVVTFLRPNYQQNLQDLYGEMRMPESAAASIEFLNHRAFAWFIMVPGLVILGILFYCRKRFLEASRSVEPVTSGEP